jgi:glycosyltransferase involved in cell wall biosynthesis
MQTKTIVHISEVDIQQGGGMARVEYNWQQAVIRAGFNFIHIGPKEIGKLWHKSLFALKALQYVRKLDVHIVAVIAHEPASWAFVSLGVPLFLESHGVERRAWELSLVENPEYIKLRTRILFPLWRLAGCDRGLKNATKLLLINSDDKDYVVKKYLRKESDIMLFKNGIMAVPQVSPLPEKFTVLFNGSWIDRKGIKVLIEAAIKLFNQSMTIEYLLIGTGKEVAEVINDWPIYLREFVTVVPTFEASQENEFLAKSSIVVLPSFFEGQPLSLLQAMAAGKPCITTDIGGQKDFIVNGVNGYLFEPGESLRLADLIKNCYINPEQSLVIGNNARASMKDRSWEKVSDDVVRFLTENISTNQGFVKEVI